MYRLIKEESMTQFANHWVSQRNRDFYATRKQNHNEAKFVSSSMKGDDINVIFKITPTYGGGDKNVLMFDEYGNEKYGKYYTFIVQFANIKKELTDWDELKFNDKRRKVLQWVDNWQDTKLYCNDPSFLTQGAWKRLDDNDSAAVPFPGFPDKGIWAAKHGTNQYITKHFLNVVDVLKFNVNSIVKMIDYMI